MNWEITKKLCSVAVLSGLAACGGGGGGGSPDLVNLTGTAGKGLLIGADVKAYEVRNGTLSSSTWATATTNSLGSYTLQGSPTSNPIVVVVTANSTTKMLDESQPQSDGTFKEVAAPTNLKLRSFVESLTTSDSVQVNPLTENAVALASNAQDSSTAKVGLTKNSLLAAKQYAQQLAPDGVNPFVAPLPAKVSDLSDEKAAKMGVMMAGLMQKASDESATCALQCQIEKLSKDVPMTLDASGKGSIDSAKADEMKAQKVAYLNAGKATLASKSDKLGTLSSTIDSAAAAAISTAQSSGIPTTTVAASEYEAINGVQGFVKTLRESFKTTEEKLKTAQTSLDTRYQKLTLQGLDYLSGIVGRAMTDCVKPTEFKCSASTGSQVTWTAIGSGWQGTYTTTEGYTIKGTVTGSLGQTSLSFSIENATVKSGTKTLVELPSFSLSGSAIVKDSFNEITAASLTMNGTAKAYDQSTDSNIVLTLGLSNIEASFSDTAASFSMKGGLSLASSKGDSLTGTMNISGVNRPIKEYGYTYTDGFITDISIALKASESSQGEMLALDVNGSRKLSDMTKARSSSNFETFNGSIGVGLAANTKVTATETRSIWEKLSTSVDLQSGSSKLRLTGDYSLASTSSDSKWCRWDQGAVLCTDTLTLSANDGTYTGVLKKSSSGTTADLYKGTATTGTKIGALTKNGMIQIDGKEYSLY